MDREYDLRQWAAEAEALAAIAVDPSLTARLEDAATRLLQAADEMAAAAGTSGAGRT